ncbi:hypothetical protein HD806DRAFT_473774 [Xylariaceae sp. AK1471]|nr:hypothetical protein HD806DRAFT_473774 [Xylariaceae sp. AK1471]
MAPQLLPQSTLVFDSRTQIIDNCEFLMSKDDIVQVITTKDPSDKFFKAYAIRCNEETREAVLVSEPRENAQKAVESLHTKSCEAVHNYITANGFANPRDLKTALLEPSADDDDDDAASIISGHSESSTAAFSEWGSSGDEAMMLQHAPDTTGPAKGGQHPAGRQVCCSAMAATTADVGAAHEPVGGASRSRASVRDLPDYANPAVAPPRTRAARPARSRSPSFTFRQAPLPPPPAHSGHPGPNRNGPPAPPPPPMRGMPMHLPPHLPPSLHPPRPQNGVPPQPFVYFRGPVPPPFPISHDSNRPGRPKPVGPNGHANDSNNGNGIGSSNPPRPLSVFSPPRTHAVRITVHWLRHGQHRIVAQCQPTRESLQSAALADVRLNPGAFPMAVDAPNNMKGNGSNSRQPILRAHVRQAVFGGEAYDMRTFHGQDLTRLFHVMAADDNIPSFEVVVEEYTNNNNDEDDEESVQGGSPSDLMKGERWD